MADFSQLSRDDLIQILQQQQKGNIESENFTPVLTPLPPKPKEVGDVFTSKENKCKYKPVRSSQNPCEEAVATPWGFCKKHSRTVQARNAERIYEESINRSPSIKKTFPRPSSPKIEEKEEPLPHFNENSTKTFKPINDKKKSPSKMEHSKTNIVSTPPKDTHSTKVEKNYPKNKSSVIKSKNTIVTPLSNQSKSNQSKNSTAKIDVQSPVSSKPKKTIENPQFSISKSKKKETNIHPSLTDEKFSHSKKQAHTSDKKSYNFKNVETKKETKKPVVRTKIIRGNYWGRFEDTETHIVFDPITSRAYGVQDPSGAVYALTDKHIKICNKNGWSYNLCEDEYDVSTSEDESPSEDSSEENNSESSSEDSSEGLKSEEDNENWDEEDESLSSSSDEDEDKDKNDEEDDDEEDDDEEDDDEEDDEEDEEEDEDY